MVMGVLCASGANSTAALVSAANAWAALKSSEARQAQDAADLVLLRDVAAGQVVRVYQTRSSAVTNTRTGERCTKDVNRLERHGSVRMGALKRHHGGHSCDVELTAAGRLRLGLPLDGTAPGR